MPATIALISYGKLSSLFEGLKFSPPPGINIKIVDAVFDGALDIAKSMEKKNEADVFISAGSNCYLLSRHLQAPLVEVKVTGFDFLLALEKARRVSRDVAVITYHQKLTYLDEVLKTLAVQVRQATFNDIDELDAVLDRLKREGATAIIGSSLVCEHAREKGLASFFIYSEDGVLRALDSAIKIAQTKKREIAKAEELQAIMNFAYEGIIAADAKGTITFFNPIAEKITGIPMTDALGKPADTVLEGSRLNHVIRSQQSQINQIQSVGDVKILTNRIPIVVQGEVVGAVATFKDVGMIQEAEEKIREKLYLKGFVAKNTFNDIIGQSQIVKEVKNEALKFARSESTILILGESGTGKELFVQAIHNASRRAKRPFVAINCAALPPSLLESELFGYAEGAFTGAKRGGKRGLFELAHSGTIFLDEIGEMPMPIQSRLLRILEEHEVLRIGGERILPVDIRVIAATNKDLWELVKTGQFREDLYYRLSVLELRLPALRERKEDIPVLVRRFLAEFRPELPSAVTAKIADNPLFAGFVWPGNVRELRNVVERLGVLYDGGESVDALLDKLLSHKRARQDGAHERESLLELLEESSGNRSAAAKKIGVSRTTLWRKLRRLNIG
jgi:propionate catabolism operon transcriptional regulator